MLLLKRLKTLWQLSGMEIKTNVDRDVYLKVEAQSTPAKNHAMATIVETEKPNLFETP